MCLFPVSPQVLLQREALTTNIGLYLLPSSFSPGITTMGSGARTPYSTKTVTTKAIKEKKAKTKTVTAVKAAKRPKRAVQEKAEVRNNLLSLIIQPINT